MTLKKKEDRIRGISVNRLLIPIIVVLVLLHAVIVSLIFMINSSSTRLSEIMRNAGVYNQEATSLLAGSSLLSETSSNYILMPVDENGEPNVAPLMAYVAELGQEEHRGAAVLARFETYDLNPDTLALIASAAESADNMIRAQMHAIALVRSVHPLPPLEPLAVLEQVELTEEEQSLTAPQKIAAARALVLNTEYGQNKQNVSQSVNQCVGHLQADSGDMAAKTGRQLGRYRAMMWAVTVSIIVILAATFLALYRQLISPLASFTKLIPEDQPLDEDRGFREVRLVASAYNGVLKRRNALDDILRSAAETDALTNLPNRYRFEQYLLESEDSDGSMAVLLFDINYLKLTNDTMGHLAGDQLIRNAAECISACFGDNEDSNCFRFGGDEFAAVLKNCTPDSIGGMIRRFEKEQKERKVSISLGYAYAEEIGNTTFRKLLDEADRQMYAYKKAAHDQA